MHPRTKAIGSQAEDQFGVDMREVIDVGDTFVRACRRATRTEQQQGIDWVLTVQVGDVAFAMYVDVKSHEHNIFGRLLFDCSLVFRNPFNIDSKATHLAIWTKSKNKRVWRIITRAEYLAQFFENDAKQVEFLLIFTLLREKNINPFVRTDEDGKVANHFVRIMMEDIKNPLNACLKPQWQVSFDSAEYNAAKDRWYNSTSDFDHIRLKLVPRKDAREKRQDAINALELASQKLSEFKKKRRENVS